MSNDNPSAALRSVAEQLISRAWEDAEFKKKLLSDPRAAIKQATGMTIPEGITLKVVEETADTLYLVLPSQVAASGELSDEALEMVAGGGKGWRPPPTTVGVNC